MANYETTGAGGWVKKIQLRPFDSREITLLRGAISARIAEASKEGSKFASLAPELRKLVDAIDSRLPIEWDSTRSWRGRA